MTMTTLKDVQDNDFAPQSSEHPNCFRNVDEYAWTDAFQSGTVIAFNQVFDHQVTQSASTSPYVIFGRNEVANTFAWASEFYRHCHFVHQARSDCVTFLEFDLLTQNNMSMQGMTILIKNTQGKVIKVFNGHRNLMAAVLFSEHFVRGPGNLGVVGMFHQKALKKYGLQGRFPRNPMGFSKSAKVTEHSYTSAIRRGSKGDFREILTPDVRLTSSYVCDVLEGSDLVSECLSLMASFYEQCHFTLEAKEGNRTYLLYNGRLRNGLVVSDGFLILVKNAEGKIAEVMDNPIPLHAGTLISAYIAKRHSNAEFAQQFLYNKGLFKRAIERYSLDNVYGKNTRNLSSFRGFIAKYFIEV